MYTSPSPSKLIRLIAPNRAGVRGGRHPYRSERSKRGEGEEERKGKKEGKKKKTASHTDSQSAERGEAAHSRHREQKHTDIYK